MGNVAPVQGPQPPVPDVAAVRRGQARKTAEQFEAVFVGEMTKIMLDSVPKDDKFGGGNAESIYSGMLAEQMGKSVAQKGGIGIASKVMNEIIKMQGGQ